MCSTATHIHHFLRITRVIPNLAPLLLLLLQVAVTIMEGYVLFGGRDFLQQHGASLAAMIDSMAGNIKEKGMTPVLNLIDTLIVVSWVVSFVLDNFSALNME